jgi:hypothetical protein
MPIALRSGTLRERILGANVQQWLKGRLGIMLIINGCLNS